MRRSILPELTLTYASSSDGLTIALESFDCIHKNKCCLMSLLQSVYVLVSARSYMLMGKLTPFVEKFRTLSH